MNLILVFQNIFFDFLFAGFQRASQLAAGNRDEGVLLKVDTTGEEGGRLVTGDGFYRDPQDEQLEGDDLESGVDKRVPSSYKLKYGGLGKRKRGSNTLRFGGLGKRVPMNRNDDVSTANEYSAIRPSSRDRGEAFEAYYDSFYPVGDRSISTEFAPRQQRKMGKGLRYSGLGKRMLKRSP